MDSPDYADCAKESNREITGLDTNHARGDQWKNLLIVVHEPHSI